MEACEGVAGGSAVNRRTKLCALASKLDWRDDDVGRLVAALNPGFRTVRDLDN